MSVSIGQTARTLPDALRSYAGDPGPRIVHVLPNESEIELSYRDLLGSAGTALGGLRAAGVAPGDRVILLVVANHELVPALWGCLLGGIVPAVLSVPSPTGRDSEALRRLQAVWAVLGRPLLVVQDLAVPFLEALSGLDDFAGLRWTTTSALSTAAPDLEHHAVRPDDVAILQFSSGSTGSPKGIRLTHENLVSNIRDIIEGARVAPDDVIVSWLPYFHDMGLIGFHLLPVYAGATQVSIGPMHFLKRPRVWLEAIGRHRGTITGTPNFGLEHCLDRALAGDREGLDLSSLRLVINGAEPISVRVMRAFTEAAAPLGLRRSAMFPVYGLAEATLAVSFPEVGREPRTFRLDRRLFARNEARVLPAGSEAEAVELVGVGRALSSVRLRLVDDEGAEVPPGRIGHIQLRGPNVTAGYEAAAEASEELFADGWLRTGDLGVQVDGELVVTGRTKDVIFVGGHNVYAHDVEARAAEALGVRSSDVVACGFTDPESGLERVGLFIRQRAATMDGERLAPMDDVLLVHFGFEPDLVVMVSAIPRTTSGKVQRWRLAELLRDGPPPVGDAVLAVHASRSRGPDAYS